MVGSADSSVRVFAFDQPPGLTISLFQCSSGEPDCLAGSFSVDSAAAPSVQQNALSEQVQGFAMANQTA